MSYKGEDNNRKAEKAGETIIMRDYLRTIFSCREEGLSFIALLRELYSAWSVDSEAKKEDKWIEQSTLDYLCKNEYLIRRNGKYYLH